MAAPPMNTGISLRRKGKNNMRDMGLTPFKNEYIKARLEPVFKNHASRRAYCFHWEFLMQISRSLLYYAVLCIGGLRFFP